MIILVKDLAAICGRGSSYWFARETVSPWG
jgi:hypothetical protein